MLEGEHVEQTPAELVSELESWTLRYPEDAPAVISALSEAMGRMGVAEIVLRPLTWGEIGTPVEREWLVDRWLPIGCVALLTGEGGAGKSRLALQLAAGLAAERDGAGIWIQGAAAPLLGGSTANGGVGVVYASWEDRSEEIARRLSQIGGNAASWCTPDLVRRLKILDLAGQGPLWSVPGRYESAQLTPLGHALRRVVEHTGSGLLVLDSLAAVYGANENDRSQVRDFMASWDAWASASGCTVLIIGHPPKSSFGYSGSTDWHSAARARWELTKESPSPTTRGSRADASHWKLAMVKSNYGPEPEAVCLGWDSAGPRWEVDCLWSQLAWDAPRRVASANGGGNGLLADI